MARRFVSAALHRAGLEHLDEIATLLVSELVTNAVLHARSRMELRLRVVEGRARIEVWDSGNGNVSLRHYADDAVTGRGLVLVEELADAWGTTHEADGKYVWFELSVRNDSLVGESV